MRWQETIAELVGEFKGEECNIVGTGPSLEGVNDASGYNVTIGLNEAVKVADVDITIMCDSRAVAKTTRFCPPFHRLVLSQACGRNLEAAHLHELRPMSTVHVVPMDASRSNRPPSQHLFCRSGVLTAALSLAEAMGFSTVNLYGCDFYRLEEKAYAWDLAPAPVEECIPIGGDRFTTPALRAMAAVVRDERAAGRWAGIETIINWSEFSQLRLDE